MKRKHNIPKLLGVVKAVLRGKFIAINAYTKNIYIYLGCLGGSVG